MDAGDPLLREVLAGNRRALARAITLLESTRPDHRRRADALLQQLLPHTGASLRLGISGVPGAGKSTLVESLGMLLVQQGHRVAVLSIDPSSTVTGGSVLADKTRMAQLAASERAFVRPSPSTGALGGVAAATREALLACEAAGHDVVIIETVGVGQSEAAVAGMTDVMLLLQLPNAGDELQAIKRGVLEMADLIAVNKVDLDPPAARRAAAELRAARRGDVRCVSALQGTGLAELWGDIRALHELRQGNGELAARREQQNVVWMWEVLRAGLQDALRDHPVLGPELVPFEKAVRESRLAPRAAAAELLGRFVNPR